MTDKYFRIIVDSKGAEANVKSFDSAMTNAGRGADRFTATMTRLAAAISAAISARQIVEYSDAWQQTQGQIRQVTKSHEDLARVTQTLLGVADDTRSSYEATVSLFTQLTRATEGLNVSEEKRIGITKTINNLMLASGGNADSMRAAIMQLGQGLASGALRGEEFNSVSEQAPLILKAIREETGKTTGELRKFAQEGGITTELLIKSLENYSEKAQLAADAMGDTFGQSLVRARNNAIAFVGANDQITKSVSLMGSSLVAVSQNLEIVQDLVIATAAVIAGRYVGAIGLWVAATVRATAAQLAANTATTTSIGLYGNQVRVMASATIATNALTVASRGAAAAMALVGGPAGAALIAASALVYFASKNETAEESVKRLTGELSAQTFAFKELSIAQAKSTRLDVQQRFNESSYAAEALKTRIKGLKVLLESNYNDGTAEKLRESLIRSEASLETAKNTAEEFRVQLIQLDGVIRNTAESPDLLAGAFDRLSASISSGIEMPLFDIPAVKKEKPNQQEAAKPTKGAVEQISLESETRAMEAELALRTDFNARYAAIEGDRLATIRTATDERIAYETASSANEISRLEIERAKVKADKDLTDQERIAQINQIDQQEIILAKTREQTILEIRRDGLAGERELLAERDAIAAEKTMELQSETAALRSELDFRAQMMSAHGSIIYDANASQHAVALAQLDMQIAEERFRIDSEHAYRIEQLTLERDTVLQNQMLTDQQRLELRMAYDAQELALKQSHEQGLTDIATIGKAAREELADAEFKTRLANFGALGDAMMNLGQGQSKKIFKVGQTLALAQAGAALPAAVIETYKNAGGFPWGVAPALTMASTGLKNIQQIRNAGAGLGGGGGGSTPSISIPSGGSGGAPTPTIPTTAQQTTQPQRRSIDLRVEPGLYTDTQVIELAKRMAGNDDAVISLTSAQGDAARRGVTA